MGADVRAAGAGDGGAVNFEDTPEEAAFREESRAFLSQHATRKEPGHLRVTNPRFDGPA